MCYCVNTMVTISLREFQLKPSKFLGDLPVTLTVYNVAKYKIVSVNTSDKVLAKELTQDKKVLTENGTATESVNTDEPKVLTDISPKKEAFEELKKEYQYNPCPKPEKQKKNTIGYKK